MKPRFLTLTRQRARPAEFTGSTASATDLCIAGTKTKINSAVCAAKVSANVKMILAERKSSLISPYNIAMRRSSRRDSAWLDLVPEISLALTRSFDCPYSEKTRRGGLWWALRNIRKAAGHAWASLNLGSFADWKAVPGMPILKLKTRAKKRRFRLSLRFRRGLNRELTI